MLKIWAGCTLPAWWSLLARNRFGVEARYLPEAVLYTLTATYHTILAGVHRCAFGRKIDAVRIEPDPVFILGHWRTGTTLMHTLLGLDPQFTFPTTSQCLNPSHLLLRTHLERWITRRNIPPRRPMDNMSLSSDSPQEDEFALCSLGLPSPYMKFAFPNNPVPYPESLSLDELPPALLEHWKQTFTRFLKQVAYLHGGRLLLKSPPHTCRIKVLLDLFPHAHFVYMVRSPYEVIPSTTHLWQTLYRTQGLQQPNFAGLEEFVFGTFDTFFERVELARPSVAAERFCEVRFEDLLAEPLQQLRRIYNHLGLGSFEKVRPAMETYLSSIENYQRHHWELRDALRGRITQRCSGYLRRHGYMA